MYSNPDAAKIKRWREDRGWSQEHLADAAGIGLRTVQRIEKGDGASRESVMALAAAFNVDVIALTIDPRIEAKEIARKERAKGKAALRLSFGINLASYIFGLIVFTGISIGDGQPGYVMIWPAVWWTVGVAGHGLVLVLVELVEYFEKQVEDVS